jgi:1-acyl-sn-glycerol-3-phosphate acyltransferase
MRRLLAGIAAFWVSVNNAIFSLFRNPRWNIQIPENLDNKGCYLVSSNHQSWVDVLVLQRSFNRKLPFFRFFIKSQMFWVPFLGIAWWSLDMPFMKRHSREKIASKPGLKGRDLENARIACEKFRTIPVAMTNFPEGTRFSRQKKEQMNSSYENLLQPRIGGIGQVFYALAEELNALIDVTIIYPQSKITGRGPTFWELLSGDISEIIVRAERRNIPPELLGRNFRTDRAFRGELEAWMSQLWQEKDVLISSILKDK